MVRRAGRSEENDEGGEPMNWTAIIIAGIICVTLIVLGYEGKK